MTKIHVYLKLSFNNKVLIFSITVTIVGFSMLPHETAPAEDRGLIGVFIPAIPGKDLDNLEANVEKVENRNLIIKWNKKSNQPDSILPIDFLIFN